MQPSKPLLELPLETAARSVALRYLRKLRRAAERVHSDPDPESIHDLRVALRRFRSWIRALGPAFGNGLRPRHRRRLRKLHSVSGRGRDADVRIAWIERLLEGGGAGEESDALLGELREVRASEAARLARRLERRVPRLARRLEKRLSTYEVSVAADPPDPPPTMAEALGAALALAAGELRARFEEVGSEVEERAAHRARIGAKRLRYLVEPFTAELPEGKELVDQLKRIQSLLGDVHDLDVLGRDLAARGHQDDALPAPLAPLSRRARLRREELASEVAAAREAGEVNTLLDRVEELAGRLGGAGEDVEIERKYLLSALPTLPEGTEVLEVEQGWFGERIPERVRRVRSAAGERAYRSIKHGRGVKRLELEEQIPPALFDVLWPLTEGRRVRKKRFRAREGELCWEVDQLSDRELVLAELEIPSEDHPVVFPSWLEPFVVREVTHEPAYLNINLAG